MVESFAILPRTLALIISTYYFFKIAFLLMIYFITHPNKELVKPRKEAPKFLNDPKYGTHRYVKVNGIRLHYVEKGDNSKPLMVFLHGFPETWYAARYQMEEFSKNYWCVSVDMRGYGESDKPKEIEAYELKNLVEDLRELVLYLGREKIYVVGHDWGAIVAWNFIDYYGDMVEKYVAISAPSIEILIRLILTESEQSKFSWYFYFFLSPYLPEISVMLHDFYQIKKALIDNKTVSRDDIEACLYYLSQPGGMTPLINYYRANFLKIHKRNPASSKVRGLYILGEKDSYISEASLTKHIKANRKLKTVLLEDGDHFINQHRYPEVNQIIQDFLTS